MQHQLQQPTVVTLRAARALLSDGQGAQGAGGAGGQITSHPGITAFTLSATAISPLRQILKKGEEMLKEGKERRESVKIVCQNG